MYLVTLLYALLLLLDHSLAGFDPRSKTNLAVYWGQNSVDSHALNVAQGRLVDYCHDPNVDIILLAFLITITDGQGNFKPVLNFANQAPRCDQSKRPYTCPEVEEDIRTCQLDKKKTILLSFGGFTSPEAGFNDDNKARVAAQKLWEMFGPPTSDPPDSGRPFGRSVVDGFDFDFEREVPGMGVFGQELHKLMGGENKRGRLITAAPQCPIPVQDSMFNQIPLDIVFVQFYNNPQCSYNFKEWNDWATGRKARWFVGLPGSQRAGAGYIEPGDALNDIFRKAKEFDRMGGAMLWDASQAWSNNNYHVAVKKALTGAKMEPFQG